MCMFQAAEMKLCCYDKWWLCFTVKLTTIIFTLCILADAFSKANYDFDNLNDKLMFKL